MGRERQEADPTAEGLNWTLSIEGANKGANLGRNKMTCACQVDPLRDCGKQFFKLQATTH